MVTDKELLEKFQKILKISNRIRQEHVAKMMDISHDELLKKLLEWGTEISFKIESDEIVVDDMEGFTQGIDAMFKDWEDNEENKNGKIENTLKMNEIKEQENNFQSKQIQINKKDSTPKDNELERKFQYFETLWKEALTKLDYKEALEIQKKALDFSEEQFDISLTKKAKQLEEKMQIHKKITGNIELSLKNQIETKKWTEAIQTLREIEEISKSNNFKQFLKKTEGYYERIKEIGIKILSNAQEKFEKGEWSNSLQLSKEASEIFHLLENSEMKRIADELLIKSKYFDFKEKAKIKITNKKWEDSLSLITKARETIHEIYLPDEEKKLNKMQAFAEKNKKIEEEQLKRTYNNVLLAESDFICLKELEKGIGNETIPNLNKINGNSFGFKAEEERVIALSLYKKKIKVIPDSIGNLSELTFLNLDKNKIEVLPDSIQKLKELKYLWIYKNNLKKLPDSMCELNNLEHLVLKSNNLVTLPESIKLLKNLKKLWLNNNKLSNIPQNVKESMNILKNNGCEIYL